MNIAIESFKEEDAKSLAEIDEVVFGGTFKEQDFLDYHKNPIYNFNVAKIDENIVGYIGYMVIADQCDIINIGILPDKRGLGIGNMLMDSMILNLKRDSIKAVYLEVRKSNLVAISLYEKYGFIVSGVSKNHYTEPTEDALRMSLCL